MENSAAFQLFPLHRVSFQGHVAVGAVLFGDAHRTRVQVKISLLKANSGKHRGMNVDAQISRLEDILTELRLKIKMCRKRQEAA